ncbi:E3 ubiquitin-protein ligase FANCL isoform X1 [Hemicordylus capensis]|uniref:E3 ubiquitin-protein ligase FANCL isoform X1 n=1 Tax=Hemicordylus capensis TaxID=884348 RepID=UPI002302DF0F|nr:E3 ubiquitin-protein ligase FANCL isoform X1 [Hemicordylus capensis]
MATGLGSLLRECPLLLPQNREGTVYEGFVTAQGRDFHIRILLPVDLQLKNARIQCSWRLKKILSGYQQILKQRLQRSSDLVSFMMELKTLLEVALKNTQELHAPPPPQYYSSLIRDIETLGWNKVVFVDPGFSIIKLKAEDSCSRAHLITLKLNPKYPTEPPDCLVDLPVQFAVSWISQVTLMETLTRPLTQTVQMSLLEYQHTLVKENVNRFQSSLLSIHSQFLAALESLKEFWNALDEIDEKTWVIEPEKPTRSATMRRIAVGNNVSINIDVDPRHPTMLPECSFLGADHVVNPLKVKLNNNIHLWDPETSLLSNLKEVLEIDFPSRETLEKSDFSMDCGICYAYRLDGVTPDQVCDDSRCGQPFHQACLYEWLRGLPSSRQSFNVIFGECPYCNKQITLKMSTKKI